MCNKNLFVFVVLLCSIVFVVKSRPAGEEDPDDELSGYENEDEEDKEVEKPVQQQQVNDEDVEYPDYYKDEEVSQTEKPEPVQQQQQQPVQQQQQPVIQQQQQQPVQQPVVVQHKPQQPATSGGSESDEEDLLAKACACGSNQCPLEEGCRSQHYVKCNYESIRAVCNGKQVFIARQSQCGPRQECYKNLNNKG